MQMYLLFATLAGCVLGGSRAQVLFSGQCPSVTLQQNFDINRYMGRWYEYQRYFTVFEIGSKCVSADYTLEGDGTVLVNNTGFYTILNSYLSIIGDAVGTDPQNPAKLGVRFSRFQSRGDYWVISTDYDSYTIVWSCSEKTVPFIGLKWNTQLLWILTRDRQGVPREVLNNLDAMLRGFGISTESLSPTTQTDCP